MLQSFALAIQNIRANLFHTFLSVLGIVIGVAALVATLSLIDGLEKYAREKIASNTDLNAVYISTQQHKYVNKLMVRKDSFQLFDYQRFEKIKAALPLLKEGMISTSFNREVKVLGRDSVWGAMIACVGQVPKRIDTILLHGQPFSEAQIAGKARVCVINEFLAKLISGANDPATAIGLDIAALGQDIRIIGVLKNKDQESPPSMFMPISLLPDADLRKAPPGLILTTHKTEDAEAFKEQIKGWLKQEFGENNDFEVGSRENMIKEATLGFLVFRIVMGLIIGLSVVVGGVGVMNVLLISVTERTAEIGLRKAVGAKKGDIRRLFLAESITVSAFGSMIGLLVGAGFAMVAIPIVRFFAEVPFSAVLSWNTLMVISVIAILVGVIFGTYPAVKAAKLDPVEALRRE